MRVMKSIISRNARYERDGAAITSSHPTYHTSQPPNHPDLIILRSVKEIVKDDQEEQEEECKQQIML